MSSTSLLNTQCSVCGAPLVFPAGKDEVLCEYCLRPNARPKSESNETTLMKYANERRNLGEFEEAENTYRKVLQKNIGEHEARWGLLLCKYGVMYVEDAASGERQITCRRVVNTAMCTDPDFRICCEQASPAVRAAYEKDAAYVDQVQAEIRRIRAEEPPYDVFICYKETAPGGGRTRDSVFAQEIFSRMKSRGFRLFYAPESLKQKSGANYEAAIFAALSDARVMLTLGTKREYFESVWVRSEWKRFLEMIDAGEEKLLVPIYRDLDPGVDLPQEFRARYLQGINMSDVGFLYDLEALLEKVIRKAREAVAPVAGKGLDRRALMNAMFMVEDGAFDEAVKALRDIIQVMPECAEAHMGLCMARAKVHSEEELPGIRSLLRKDKDFCRAMRFASEKEKTRWKELMERQETRLAKKRAEEEASADGGSNVPPGGDQTAQETSAAGSGSAHQEALDSDGIAALIKCARKNDVEAQYLLGTIYEEGRGVPADLRQAFAWYRLAVKQGHPGAQYRLAEMHRHGENVNKSMEEAVRLLRLAVAQNYAPALYTLGTLYQKGEGVGQDEKEALRLYKQSAEGGWAAAQYQMGYIYHTGWRVVKDPAEAARWYRMAADQGYAPAQLNLGAMYSNGYGVAEDKAEASRLYRLAAEQGLAQAQNEMGSLCYHGVGVETDVAEAARWYRLAAEQGHVRAQYHLGCLYLVGEGVQKDTHMALKWFRKASDQGDAAAKCRIGDIYYNGVGVPENRNEAARWYRISASMGYPQAQFNVGTLYYSGIAVIKDRMGATRWYRMAAKQGHVQAMLMLASMLYKGDGVPPKKEEGLRWYLHAAEQGDAQAQYDVAMMYHDGEGFAADKAEAFRWCAKSAAQGFANAQYQLGTMYYQGDGTAADKGEAARWLNEAVENGSESAQRFIEVHRDLAKQMTQSQTVQALAGRRQSPEEPAANDAGADDGSAIRDSWEQIIAAIDDGSARRRYPIGGWKPLSLGSLGEVAIQLAGFELDERADGKGRAGTTWIARRRLPAARRMNPVLSATNPPYGKGTGAVGGWDKCELRRYLADSLMPLLPDCLRERIVVVLKKQAAYNASGYAMQQRTVDALWIPDANEIDGTAAPYGSLFAGMAPHDGMAWWLRTASEHSSFLTIGENGEKCACPSERELGVIIGFCL